MLISVYIRMFKLMLILVFQTQCVKNNEAITIDNYQLEVFNSETKYTVDLTQTNDEPVYINKFDSITLTCNATGSSFYVALLRNDNEFKREFLPNGQSGKVTITHTQTDMDCSDAARFTCRTGNIQEWRNITQIIIVKCLMPPVRFKSNNVNKIVGANDLTFTCEKSKEVDINEAYNMTIRKNSDVIMTTHLDSSISLTVSPLRCEDMGTYSCETKTEGSTYSSHTDLFVHNCPPLLTQSIKQITPDRKSSVHFTVNATLSRKLCMVTVFYKTFQTECDKCVSKLCAKIVSKENWITQIQISIYNITEEDYGNETLRICTETGEKVNCSYFSLIINKNENHEKSTNNKGNSTIEISTQVLNMSVSSPTWTTIKNTLFNVSKSGLRKKNRKGNDKRNNEKSKKTKKTTEGEFKKQVLNTSTEELNMSDSSTTWPTINNTLFNVPKSGSKKKTPKRNDMRKKDKVKKTKKMIEGEFEKQKKGKKSGTSNIKTKPEKNNT